MREATKKNILAIDDNSVSLTVINTILEGSYKVYLAKNTELATKILHAEPIDLILLDLEMPDMPGIDFLDAIHNNTSFYYIPIIIVSSHGTEDLIVKAKKKGASGFVVKPCNPKTLIDKIEATLKIARKKISWEVLARKLNILETACIMKQNSRISEIINELEQVHCDIAVDLELTEICKNARAGEYKTVSKKISALLKEI